MYELKFRGSVGKMYKPKFAKAQFFGRREEGGQ